MNLIPGAVTPLGVLNDVDKRVHVWIDEEFVKSESMLIGVHPNDNTATVWMKVQDLIKIIEEHGNVVSISKMDVLS
jgi:Ala-tRNA(Pro) deacylase